MISEKGRIIKSSIQNDGFRVRVPDISVIIPTYNRAEFICNAVRSCLNQIDCTIEIIVVDDGSSDNTQAVLENMFIEIFQDESNVIGGCQPQSLVPEEINTTQGRLPIIRYFYRQNEGVCATRNYGLSHAKGKYVKFLDSDDELIAHAVSQELSYAFRTNADVVVTGWQEHFHHKDRKQPAIRHVSAPQMDRGIDDMLIGKSPWTAAAVYRRAFVKDLLWDPAFGKADDWGWALTVCLSGARFCTLDIESAIYHHFSVERITSRGNPFLDSTLIRQRILRMVEDNLRENHTLTEARRNALVQYYYKDAKVLCEWNTERWHELWAHCRELVPGFIPLETDFLTRHFLKLFGVYNGIRVFVRLRKIARVLGLKRFRAGDSKTD
jgi:glycosyltransferase involved in cell wall biosynthesis